MIVVLEGPDGAGKTTIADSIRALYPERYVSMRCGPPGYNAMKEYHDVVDRALESKAGIVVVDRLHVGELVYGPIFRCRSQITIDQAREIDQRLDHLGAIKVAVMPTVDELRRRQMRRDGGAADEKSGATMAHTHAIRARYAWIFSGLNGWLHVGDGPTNQIAASIMERK